MATKQTPKTPPAPRRQLTESQKWGYGLILLCFGLFVLVSVASYFVYWAGDQAVVRGGDMYEGGGTVMNFGGPAGAWLADFIVGRWFGVFGVVIPVVLIILALRIMDFRPVVLRRSVRISLILMIIGSLFMGFVFGMRWNVFGSGLGGAQGIFVAEWLESVLGWAGALLSLCCAAILLAVYISRSTISFMNKAAKGFVDGSVKVGGAAIQQTATFVGKVVNKETGRDGETPPTPATAAEPVAAGPRPEPEPLPAPAEVKKSPGDSPFEIVRPGEEEEVSGGDDEASGIFEIVAPESDAPAYAPPVSQPGGSGDVFEIVDRLFAAEDPGDAAEEAEPGEEGAFEVVDYGAGVMGAGGVAETGGSGELNVLQSSHNDAEAGDGDMDAALYDPTLELSKYQRPPVEILEDHRVEVQVTEEEIQENNNRIVETLKNFGISISKVKATIGPTVTLYEIVPAPGVRIAKIKNLEEDIALSLSALGIRIIAPIPGKGTIGIEVPNKDKEVVSMYSVVRSIKFQDSSYELPVVLGRTIQNETFVIDLAKMPHLLVAGATGQGKSVGLNAIITSLLYKKHPAELKFVLVDPKKVELTLYSKLERHFLAGIPGEDEAIITDTQKVIYTLNSLCVEMDSRYDLLRKAEVRHVKEYNEKFVNRRLNPNKGHRYLPYIVVVIDEFADMIMTAGREIETPIARIAQLARAVGIHLVIATQRPTTNIITGVIKANFPARIAFRVSSMIDSRTIIDQPGANQLIGRGDMLVSTGSDITRVQCAFIDTPEIERITEFIGNQRGYGEPYRLPEYVPEGEGGGKNVDLGHKDDMFDDVARFVVQNQQGSTSAIQRRFSIGYNRAGRIMDQIEAAGIVGSASGSKPREVLIMDVMTLEQLLSNM